MATLGKIRRMFYRDGLNLSEISRRTSLSRNTIREWLKKPGGSEPKYRREPRPGKLTPYEARLVRLLETDTRRPKRDRRTARALHAELKKQGFDGGSYRFRHSSATARSRISARENSKRGLPNNVS